MLFAARLEQGVDVPLHLLYRKRGVVTFEGCDEIFPEGVAARGIVGDFLHGVFGVVRVAH